MENNKDFDKKNNEILQKILLAACESVSMTACFIVIHGTRLCFS